MIRDAISVFQTLPALRGFWPGSAHYYDGSLYLTDMSGNGRNLLANDTTGQISFNWYNYSPWIVFNGSGRFYSSDHAHFDISGTEAYVSSTIRGITFGGWFHFFDTGTQRAMMAKYVATGNQRSYIMWRYSNNKVRVGISGDGSTFYTLDSTNTVAVDTWYFCVGKYDLSTSPPTLAVWLDDVKNSSQSSSYPSSIYNSTAPFEIGAYSNGAVFLYGRAAWLFLCAAELDDDTVLMLWHITRKFFGK